MVGRLASGPVREKVDGDNLFRFTGRLVTQYDTGSSEFSNRFRQYHLAESISTTVFLLFFK